MKKQIQHIQQNKNIVLAIFPSSKGFGYAIMESPLKAIAYRMVALKSCKSNSYRARTRMLLDFFKPKVVILEDKLNRKGKKVKEIINIIEEEATKQKLNIFKYSREDIRNVFQTFVGNRVTKYEIANFIAQEIPELQHRLKEERRIWESEDFFMPVFDSFALAMTHYYNN